MGKKFFLMLVLINFVLLNQTVIKADDKFNPKLKISSGSNSSNDKFNRDYDKAKKDHAARTGALLGASLDFQLGYGATNPSINETSGSEKASTDSKGGITFGALLNVSLFNIFTLTTGLDFTKKNFEVGLPYSVSSVNEGDSLVKNLANNYLNIPVNLNFGGMISENIGLSFSGGPYFGFLLNPSTEVSGYKDFDLGLNGILTANYLLNSFTSIILGTELQYGGLNNLMNAGSVETAHTLNWNAFTGLRIGFDF